MFRPKYGYNPRTGWRTPSQPSEPTDILEALKEDMILWWDMQDTSNTVPDLSGNNRAGTASDDVINITFNDRNWKKIDNNLGFIRVTNLPNTSQYTVGGVYRTGTIYYGGTGRFFGLNSTFKLELGVDNTGKVKLYPVNGNWDTIDYVFSLQTTHMIFLDCDGVNTYLYIDGEKVHTWTGIHNVWDGDGKFGNSEGFNEPFINGSIGLVLITDRSLSESEHEALYNQEKEKYGIT